MAIQIRTNQVNATEHYQTGWSDWYDVWTGPNGLFKTLQKEYGRCISKMYQDAPDGTADPIGWVFQKRERYERSTETFLQETWIAVREGQG